MAAAGDVANHKMAALSDLHVHSNDPCAVLAVASLCFIVVLEGLRQRTCTLPTIRYFY